jgi:hypothetical protein
MVVTLLASIACSTVSSLTSLHAWLFLLVLLLLAAWFFAGVLLQPARLVFRCSHCQLF